MAGLRLAVVAFHLCLLLSSSSSLRRLYDEAGSTPRHDRSRTAYHFQPAKNWQNDPNGPMYHNGMYHFFYQYNPHGATWGNGNLSWGHSVSVDLINWTALDTALDPDSPFDANGCWSGSATILPDGNPAMLYTGIDAAGNQVQNVAFPKNASDPLLRQWVKPDYNPVIPLPKDVVHDNFRDPSTAWRGRDGLWRVAVAAKVNVSVGSTLIYRSKDFRRWERNAAPLYKSTAAGMVECPDLFPVAEPGAQNGLNCAPSNGAARHVLKLSVMATTQDYYVVGRYDDTADTFEAADADNDSRTWRRLDYGHVYASKTFFDARKNRRVLWGWANESDTEADYVARGWSGVQTVPRKIWLDIDGKQLLQWPIKEIETLRKKKVGFQGTNVNSGSVNEIIGVAGSQADVEVVFKIPTLEGAENIEPNELLDPQKLCGKKGASMRGGIGPFGLLVLASGDLQEHTSVFFSVFKHDGKYKVLMCTDLTRSTTRADVYKPSYGGFVDMDIKETKSISLRTLIDHSVVESFGGGGRACITARVYPEHVEMSNSHLYMFNNGTTMVKVSKAEAWEMATATMNVAGDG
ncbi:beta-fructofuranosidase, insoluble isoenzyme 7-like [Lolium rigidum]|uniref:beta-fructofuranosidase, insoluble isoenzyme 7-like n=1 Tax=Lolium rigidum TaxID=89674 RepID=UPI001F5C47BC|nr:beta-fructofuranosidase, insoluble isoenzyme 7-like [Lolium rigidum]